MDHLPCNNCGKKHNPADRCYAIASLYTEGAQISKPPIGLKPEAIWLQERADEILEAMHRQMTEGNIINWELLAKWGDELSRVARLIGEARKREKAK